MRVGWIYATRLQGMLWGGFFFGEKEKEKEKEKQVVWLFGWVSEQEGRRKKEMGKGEEKKI
jgi:hypothetical protein